MGRGCGLPGPGNDSEKSTRRDQAQAEVGGGRRRGREGEAKRERQGGRGVMGDCRKGARGRIGWMAPRKNERASV
jgi:hypothetical protein